LPFCTPQGHEPWIVPRLVQIDGLSSRDSGRACSDRNCAALSSLDRASHWLLQQGENKRNPDTVRKSSIDLRKARNSLLGNSRSKIFFAIQFFSSLELMSAILQSVKTLGMDSIRGTPYVHRRRKDFLVIIMIPRGNGCILTGNRAGSLSTQCRTLHIVVHKVAIYWPWPAWQKAHR
jgi:hypothetical protein